MGGAGTHVVGRTCPAGAMPLTGWRSVVSDAHDIVVFDDDGADRPAKTRRSLGHRFGHRHEHLPPRDPHYTDRNLIMSFLKQCKLPIYITNEPGATSCHH